MAPGASSRAAHVERLHDAFAGIAVPRSGVGDARVRPPRKCASSISCERAFERAPIAGAKRAAKAPLLVFAMDEPGDGRGPTELDGERPHEVRVGVVDLAAAKLLLRLRRRVDPSLDLTGGACGIRERHRQLRARARRTRRRDSVINPCLKAGTWIAKAVQPTALPDLSYFELTVGDNTLELEVDEVADVITDLLTRAASRIS